MEEIPKRKPADDVHCLPSLAAWVSPPNSVLKAVTNEGNPESVNQQMAFTVCPRWPLGYPPKFLKNGNRNTPRIPGGPPRYSSAKTEHFRENRAASQYKPGVCSPGTVGRTTCDGL